MAHTGKTRLTSYMSHQDNTFFGIIWELGNGHPPPHKSISAFLHLKTFNFHRNTVPWFTIVNQGTVTIGMGDEIPNRFDSFPGTMVIKEFQRKNRRRILSRNLQSRNSPLSQSDCIITAVREVRHKRATYTTTHHCTCRRALHCEREKSLSLP